MESNPTIPWRPSWRLVTVPTEISRLRFLWKEEPDLGGTLQWMVRW
jgi:hypothetical protein